MIRRFISLQKNIRARNINREGQKNKILSHRHGDTNWIYEIIAHVDITITVSMSRISIYRLDRWEYLCR